RPKRKPHDSSSGRQREPPRHRASVVFRRLSTAWDSSAPYIVGSRPRGALSGWRGACQPDRALLVGAAISGSLRFPGGALNGSDQLLIQIRPGSHSVLALAHAQCECSVTSAEPRRHLLERSACRLTLSRLRRREGLCQKLAAATGLGLAKLPGSRGEI